MPGSRLTSSGRRFIHSLGTVAIASLVSIAAAALATPARGDGRTAAPSGSAVPSAGDEGAGVREPIDPGKIGAGELLWKSSRGFVPLPVADIDVSVTVTGIMVHGVVKQSFENTTGEVIETLYLFPLPERAAVDRMEMRIGDRRIASAVREKAEARADYEQASASGRKAALLESASQNLFTAAVANINPGETVEVTLEYFEELQYDDGEFGLRVPLTYTPQFGPSGRENEDLPGGGFTTPENGDPAEAEVDRGTDSDEYEVESGTTDAGSRSRPSDRFVGPGSLAAPRARIRVVLDGGPALETIRSSSHTIETIPRDGRFEIVTRPDVVQADRDFRLTWRPRLGESPRAVAFVEDREDGRYALLMLLPPAPNSEAGLGLPAETLFVIDVSGSMDGPSIEQARLALLAALDRQRPDDRFGILAFNDGIERFSDRLLYAEGDSLNRARDWVSGLEAGGGTLILPAFQEGLRMLHESDSMSHEQRIIFLTDGAVENDGELLSAVSRNLGEIRLHMIGIGSAPNVYLMRRAASSGRGLSEFVADPSTLESRVTAFLERLERPVVTDVDVTWQNPGAVECFPERPPDLYSGQPLILSARLPAGTPMGRVVLTGRTRAGDVREVFALPETGRTGNGVAARWAKARIDSLIAEQFDGVDPTDIRKAVLDIALPFQLVTPYTSLLAVEERPTALGDAVPVRLANALPQGGTLDPLLLRIGILLTLAGGGGLALRRWTRS